MALRDIGANYECVGWSEIDRWAIKAHNVNIAMGIGAYFSRSLAR